VRDTQVRHRRRGHQESAAPGLPTAAAAPRTASVRLTPSRAGGGPVDQPPRERPARQCWPGGVPFVFWNLGMQMIQQPSKITILYANDYAYRQVRLNQPHPANVAPSWYGDSVGHYEGDTLVIDTVGVKVGPFAMLDMFGTPFTEALHVIERYRLLVHRF
jgi:hypothetical protein